MLKAACASEAGRGALAELMECLLSKLLEGEWLGSWAFSAWSLPFCCGLAMLSEASGPGLQPCSQLGSGLLWLPGTGTAGGWTPG